MTDIIYHVGRLDIDRLEDGALDRKASRMMLQAREGKVILYQRRPGPRTEFFNVFEYHARFIKGAL